MQKLCILCRWPRVLNRKTWIWVYGTLQLTSLWKIQDGVLTKRIALLSAVVSKTQMFMRKCWSQDADLGPCCWWTGILGTWQVTTNANCSEWQNTQKCKLSKSHLFLLCERIHWLPHNIYDTIFSTLAAIQILPKWFLGQVEWSSPTGRYCGGIKHIAPEITAHCMLWSCDIRVKK